MTETEAELDATPVEEVLRALSSALRSYRLYEGDNPMVDRFVATLRAKLELAWEVANPLWLSIEENRIVWEGQQVFPSAESGAELAFLFYKDGIRDISLRHGIEETEIVDLLRVLAKAALVKNEEDDMVTLLPQEDLTYFGYRTVETGDEAGVPYERSKEGPPEAVDPAAVHRDKPEREGISPDEFKETLYFLDPPELRRLQDEVKAESERDLWSDILNALLDRVEDGDVERQQRIIKIFAELLPSALGNAQFERGGALLGELVAIAKKPDTLKPEAIRDVRALFESLGEEKTIDQLADILEELPDRLSEDAVIRLLGYFPPTAIKSLLRASERVEQPSVKRAFEACVQRLAESNRDEIVALLESDDPHVITGALRWVGRLQIGSALNDIKRFLTHADAAVRLEAIEALVSVRAATAASALVPLLNDPVRDVRIEAARAIGTLNYAAGRSVLEKALASKRLREGDRLEKIAFFESYGRLSGADGVPILDKILNSSSWLGRGESAENRACAALALAKIRHPSATEALARAEKDSDAVVRTAVTRALRER